MFFMAATIHYQPHHLDELLSIHKQFQGQISIQKYTELDDKFCRLVIKYSRWNSIGQDLIRNITLLRDQWLRSFENGTRVVISRLVTARDRCKQTKDAADYSVVNHLIQQMNLGFSQAKDIRVPIVAEAHKLLETTMQAMSELEKDPIFRLQIMIKKCAERSDERDYLKSKKAFDETREAINSLKKEIQDSSQKVTEHFAEIEMIMNHWSGVLQKHFPFTELLMRLSTQCEIDKNEKDAKVSAQKLDAAREQLGEITSQYSIFFRSQQVWFDLIVSKMSDWEDSLTKKVDKK